MKIACVTIAALIAVVSAAPTNSDGNTECHVQGFTVNNADIADCCTTNLGGSEMTEWNALRCSLPEKRAGRFSRCVEKIDHGSSVGCAVGESTPPPSSYDMSVCTIDGNLINRPKVLECCLASGGGAQDEAIIGCNLSIGQEGEFERCINDLGFGNSVRCHLE
ncbi:hypothetical protein BGZ72_003806 [Mortierella alpina]|nr:hypothetical protein BGZ72_003806 [Mortierella alpina]